MPDTHSIELINNKYNNLIKQYNITDTRGKLYDKPIRYADYMFTSNDVQVKEFGVLNVAVSDHLPLVVEFV